MPVGTKPYVCLCVCVRMTQQWLCCIMLLIGYSVCSTDYEIEPCSYQASILINSLPRSARLFCWECFDRKQIAVVKTKAVRNRF